MVVAVVFEFVILWSINGLVAFLKLVGGWGTSSKGRRKERTNGVERRFGSGSKGGRRGDGGRTMYNACIQFLSPPPRREIYRLATPKRKEERGVGNEFLSSL